MSAGSRKKTLGQGPVSPTNKAAAPVTRSKVPTYQSSYRDRTRNQTASVRPSSDVPVPPIRASLKKDSSNKGYSVSSAQPSTLPAKHITPSSRAANLPSELNRRSRYKVPPSAKTVLKRDKSPLKPAAIVSQVVAKSNDGSLLNNNNINCSTEIVNLSEESATSTEPGNVVLQVDNATSNCTTGLSEQAEANLQQIVAKDSVAVTVGSSKETPNQQQNDSLTSVKSTTKAQVLGENEQQGEDVCDTHCHLGPVACASDHINIPRVAEKHSEGREVLGQNKSVVENLSCSRTIICNAAYSANLPKIPSLESTNSQLEPEVNMGEGDPLQRNNEDEKECIRFSEIENATGELEGEPSSPPSSPSSPTATVVPSSHSVHAPKDCNGEPDSCLVASQGQGTGNDITEKEVSSRPERPLAKSPAPRKRKRSFISSIINFRPTKMTQEKSTLEKNCRLPNLLAGVFPKRQHLSRSAPKKVLTDSPSINSQELEPKRYGSTATPLTPLITSTRIAAPKPLGLSERCNNNVGVSEPSSFSPPSNAPVILPANQEGTRCDVAFSKIVLFYNNGVTTVASLRLKNITSGLLYFRISPHNGNQDRFAIEPKEGKLDSQRNIIVKISCESGMEESLIRDQLFKIETIRIDAGAQSYAASKRIWMNVPPSSIQAAFTSSSVLFDAKNPFFKHYIQPEDSRSHRTSNVAHGQHSSNAPIDLKVVLAEIQIAQAEQLRMSRYRYMQFVAAAMLIGIGCMLTCPTLLDKISNVFKLPK